MMKEEINQERQQVMMEKEEVKCLMLELEDRQNCGSANKGKKKMKKSNMPRQMPS